VFAQWAIITVVFRADTQVCPYTLETYANGVGREDNLRLCNEGIKKAEMQEM